MSQTAPYAASVVALLPVINEPVLDAKRLTIHTAIAASNDNSTTPLILTYWPGSEPRAAGIDDTVLVSGSARFTASNNVLTAFSEASFVNVIIASENSSAVDPASDATAIFFLTGMVLMIAPGDREFELETGCWSSEASTVVKWTAVCRFPSTKRWEHTVPPAISTPASVRAKYDGHEGGKPIFIIEELTYLPKLLRSSPRKSTSASPSSAPAVPNRLFGRGKKRTAAPDSTDEKQSGLSEPSPKRVRFEDNTPSESPCDPTSTAEGASSRDTSAPSTPTPVMRACKRRAP